MDTCDKYYRFLEVLDAYNIPLVNLVDTPPLVPGETEEARGLLRHVGKILDVYATTTVPKIGVVLREAYADAGSLIMSGLKGMGADLTYAWPIARFAALNRMHTMPTGNGHEKKRTPLRQHIHGRLRWWMRSFCRKIHARRLSKP